MDIKKYEVLLSVIDRGIFIRACDDLKYTQSGITNMMNSLKRRSAFPFSCGPTKGFRSRRMEGESCRPSGSY